MKKLFHSFATRISLIAGSWYAFLTALLVIVGWMISGPAFHFSETWQLIINTSTTIITFLMVFLIQHTQNADTKAIHLKLDEIIKSLDEASNSLIGVEKKDDYQ
jgi:low affinity Fe/Cu permease